MEANAQNQTLNFNVEPVYGATPVAPEMIPLLHTSASVDLEKGIHESQNVGIAKRTQNHSIETSRKSGLNLNAEFTMFLFETFRNLGMRGILVDLVEDQSTVTGNVSLDSVLDQIQFASDADYQLFKGVKLLKIVGSANAANDKTYRVVSVGADFLQLEADAITADDDTATTAGLTFSANYMRDGKEESKGIHIERGFTDIGKFESWTGLILDTLTVEIPSAEVLSLTTTMVGQNVTPANATVAGSVVAPNTEAPIPSCAVPGQIFKDGVKIADLSKISFTIANNVRDKPVIGSCVGLKRADGNFDTTGSITAYTADNDLFIDYLAHGDLSLEIPLAGSDGRQALLYIPRIQQASNSKGSPAVNTDIMQEVSWKAYQDSTKEFLVQIDII